jgi:hypothetical protein
MSCGGMPGNGEQMRWADRASVAALLTLALLAGGCSASGVSGGSPAPETSGSSWSISHFFAGSSAKSQQTVTGADPSANCPPIEIRQGASTLTISPQGDRSNMSVRYQASFLREARECNVASGEMVMKVGVQGRVIVGPAGGPGQLDVPLRIAVVQETPGGTRSITTKFVRIPVAVTGGPDGTVFTYIEDALTFPLPASMASLDDYIVYFGFDPVTAEMQDREKAAPAPKSKTKAKAKPTASTN